MQQAGAPTAHMSQNLRARGEAIRAAAEAAQIGNVEKGDGGAADSDAIRPGIPT